MLDEKWVVLGFGLVEVLELVDVFDVLVWEGLVVEIVLIELKFNFWYDVDDGKFIFVNCGKWWDSGSL